MTDKEKAIRAEIFQCNQAINNITSVLSASQNTAEELTFAACALDGWNSRLFTAIMSLASL